LKGQLRETIVHAAAAAPAVLLADVLDSGRYRRRLKTASGHHFLQSELKPENPEAVLHI